jgi:hypothetical protein
MSMLTDIWIDESSKIAQVTGDQGSRVLYINMPDITGTVTATNCTMGNVTVTETAWLVNPVAYDIMEEVMEGPKPPVAYDGPPRNRHERRAAAKKR